MSPAPVAAVPLRAGRTGRQLQHPRTGPAPAGGGGLGISGSALVPVPHLQGGGGLGISGSTLVPIPHLGRGRNARSGRVGWVVGFVGVRSRKGRRKQPGCRESYSNCPSHTSTLSDPPLRARPAAPPAPPVPPVRAAVSLPPRPAEGRWGPKSQMAPSAPPAGISRARVSCRHSLSPPLTHLQHCMCLLELLQRLSEGCR